MSARNGFIALSYARSAGTGDQPVPGTVTSRRNTSRQERQAVLKKRQEEEVQLKKRKEEQDQIAKILAHKWAEEDKKKGSKRRPGEDRREDGSDDVERSGADADRRSGGGRRDASRSRSEDRHRQRRRRQGEAEASSERRGRETAPPEELAERTAGWVTVERRGSASGPEASRAVPPEAVTNEAKRRASAAAAADAAGASSATGGASASASASAGSHSSRRRFTEVTGAGSAGPPPTAPASSSSSDLRGAGVGDRGDDERAGGRAHSSKVANVFGFGIEDEDDDAARREKELAKTKKSKLSSLPKEAPVNNPLGAAATAARRPMDMCEQLMKMAEWKRSCGGKRVPMPKDLEKDVARAMGGIM